MKIIKLYQIITLYILSMSIFYQFINQDLALFIKNNRLLGITITVVLISLVIYSFYLWYKKEIIPYSILFHSFFLLFVTIYLVDITAYIQFIILGLTIITYYFINTLHDKIEVKTKEKMYYKLKIRNNFLLSVIYIGYGVFCYLAFISTAQIKSYFKTIESASLFVFYPYFIIVFILLISQYNLKTDAYNTKKTDIKLKISQKILSLIILNIVSLFFFLYS